jgi:hypothetical protein
VGIQQTQANGADGGIDDKNRHKHQSREQVKPWGQAALLHDPWDHISSSLLE